MKVHLRNGDIVECEEIRLTSKGGMVCNDEHGPVAFCEPDEIEKIESGE